MSGLLIVIAGGPISDALFGRGGTTAMTSVDFDPRLTDFVPLDLVETALLRIGIIPLIAMAATTAFIQRSWGLGFLAAAGAFGLLEAETLHSALPQNDSRIIWLATAVAMIGALSSAGSLLGRMRGWRRNLATGAVGLLVVLPTGLPRAVSGAQLALEGLELGYPNVQDPINRFLNRTQFGTELEKNWDFYDWLARSMPIDVRLLTTHPSVSASTGGVAAPTSGGDLQTLSPIVTPVYEDALRFLHRDDLKIMRVTHLHITDSLEAALSPSARQLLDDPDHFKLMVDLRSISGMRHRVFEILPGAGTTEAAPSSYRFLREVVPSDASILAVGPLSLYQRRMILLTFADHDDLRVSSSTDVDRATKIPRFDVTSDIPGRGIAVLPDYVEPIALGQTRADAVWTGYGMRAYEISATWTPVWRIGPNLSGLPDDLRLVCESAADRALELRMLGEPGAKVIVGLAEVGLIGVPQEIQLSIPDCRTLALVARADVAPFAQIRSPGLFKPTELVPTVAGLGFDGGVDGERAIVNLWYRNPLGIPFKTGTELRLYESDPTGVVPSSPDPRSSIRWSSGPLGLAPEEQMTRIDFDAMRLEIDGQAGAGKASGLARGRAYILALNVAGADPRSGYVEIQQVVPLLRVVLTDGGVSYDVFSGVVAIEHWEPGVIVRQPGRIGFIGLELDLTPR